VKYYAKFCNGRLFVLTTESSGWIGNDSFQLLLWKR